MESLRASIDTLSAVEERRAWRLVLQSDTGHHNLAAVSISPTGALPDVIAEIDKHSTRGWCRRAGLPFRAQAEVVVLGKPSRVRFQDLSRRGDIAAFNNDRYEAVFSEQRYDFRLSAALDNPRQASVASDVMEYYSDLFAFSFLDIEKGSSVSSLEENSSFMALKINQEMNPRVFATAVMLLLLLLSLACLFGVGASAREWDFDAQAGFNAAEVAIAYASFVRNVYRAGMR